jgi:hypothetical protein
MQAINDKAMRAAVNMSAITISAQRLNVRMRTGLLNLHPFCSIVPG